jgi:hypothetical protein
MNPTQQDFTATRSTDHRSTTKVDVSMPEPNFSHLRRMMDGTALFEHAWHGVPRWEHGYCTDDVSRALLAVARSGSLLHRGDPDGALTVMALGYLRAATLEGCPVKSRMDHKRAWVDEGPCFDTDGRVLWALGTAAARHPDVWARTAAGALFASIAPTFTAPHPRSVAFAALGAVEALHAAGSTTRGTTTTEACSATDVRVVRARGSRAR